MQFLIINNLQRCATFVIITEALVSYYYLLIVRLYSYFPRMYPVSSGSHPGHHIISHLDARSYYCHFIVTGGHHPGFKGLPSFGWDWSGSVWNSSWCLSHSYTDINGLEEDDHRDSLSFHHFLSESSWLNFVDVNFCHLVEMASVGFLHATLWGKSLGRAHV